MPRDEIIISKSVMPDLPPDYEETFLGDKMGAKRQFRNKSGFHVREYEDRFVIHRDSFDPRSNPVRHLLHDSPETLLAACAGLRLARRYGLFSPLIFLLSFFSLNSIFRRLKHLIFF